MPLLLTMLGGALIFIGELVDVPLAVSGLGFVLFGVGVLWVFVAAIRLSRREGMGLGRAIFVSTKDSLRFAAYFFP
jgi:hypothetical protein